MISLRLSARISGPSLGRHEALEFVFEQAGDFDALQIAVFGTDDLHADRQALRKPAGATVEGSDATVK